MDGVSSVVGLIGFTKQLADTAIQCYGIFSDMKDVGEDRDNLCWELEVQKVRLENWAERWNRIEEGNSISPMKNKRQYLAIETLAKIVALFASVDKLQSMYGIEVINKQETKVLSKPSGISRWLKPRSQSTGTQSTGSVFRSRSPSPIQRVPTLDPTLVSVLEESLVLSDKDLVPEIEKALELRQLSITNFQQLLPFFKKFRWAVEDKTRSKGLTDQLQRYINGLFDLLPAKISVTSPEGSPAIVYKIPFHLDRHRNEFFTGQDSYMEKIKQACISSKVVVLHGLGGIGKTQLALEYAYRYQSKYTSIFWVNCSSGETVMQGFTGIAQQLIRQQAVASKVIPPDYNMVAHLLQMAGAVGNNGEVIEAARDTLINGVKRWLSMSQNQNWLLILDNVDDLRSFNIRSYIPTCEHGTIIMTSRRQECALFGNGLYVDEMAEKDGLELLLKISKLQDENTATEIVRLLGYLPLAIDQAATYIAIQKISLTRYLDVYRRNKEALLKRKQDTAIWIYNESVYTTWEVSFKAIEAENSQAIELLEFFAFIANDNIREDFIYRCFQVKENDTSIDDAIGLLVSYSLIKRKSASDTISDDAFDTISDAFVIHPLVHAWTFDQLGVDKQVQYMIEALRRVSAILVTEPTVRLKKVLKDEQQLLHHIEALYTKFITIFGTNIPVDKEIFNACYIIGLVLFYNMQYEKALQWYERALDSKQEVLESPKLYKQEKDDWKLLELLHDIATLFRDQKQYDKAQELYEYVLISRERVLGKEHPDTLNTLHNLARLFDDQRQNDEAQKLYEQALAGREKVLGKEHPHTLRTLNNLAGLFEKQGQNDKAQKLYEQVLAGQEKVLGKEHLDNLTTLNNLAGLFNNQGQNDKAQKLYEQALAVEERVLGKEHPHTLHTLCALAISFAEQGQNEKAQKLYEQALLGQERVLGKEHPDTLRTLHNLALSFNDQGQNVKAKKLYEQALVGQERVLGKEHPDTLRTLYNLALSFNNQGQNVKAQELFEQALAGREKVLGKEHPDTLTTLYAFAILLKKQGKYDESFKLADRALIGREKALGKDHIKTLYTRILFADVLVKRDDRQLKVALQMLEETLAKMEKIPEKDDKWEKIAQRMIEELKARERSEAGKAFSRFVAGWRRT